LALVHLDDASVATTAIFLGGSDLVEENLNHVFLVKAGNGEAAVMDGAGFAEGNHLFSDAASGLGLREGRFDTLVLDKATHKVGEHGVAMFARASQLGGAFQVAHIFSF